jgi:short-subunit dehydrogenase involved in D-alanine esterification of teichoic acids
MATSTASKYTSKLHEKRVLIFGGTPGIGFGVAEASIESAVTVFISGSRQPKIDASIQRIKSSYPDCGTRISGYAYDLADTQILEQNSEALLKVGTSGSKEKLDHTSDRFTVKSLADATV